MSKYCPDLNCDFFEAFPNGTVKMKTPACPYCQSPFADEKPLPPDQLIEEQSITTDLSLESDRDLLITNKGAIHSIVAQSFKPSGPPADNVIVTLYTVIRLSHLVNNGLNITLQFQFSPLADLQLGLLEFKSYKVRSYEDNKYALLSNSVSIPSKILDNSGANKTIIIPYSYYIGNEKEKYYSNKALTYRCLVLSFSNFFAPNVLNKYDMLILPSGLTQEERYYYKDLQRLLGIVFSLYNPIVECSDKGRLLPFVKIKNELQIFLHSLCSSHVICKIKKYFLSKEEYICTYLTTKEEVNIIMRDLLFGWIITLVQSDLPFHLKFYLSFLCLDPSLMEQCALGIFGILFGDISSEYILSVIQAEEKMNLFFEYQTEIQTSPQLLHCAMQRVSELDTDSLMLFLPLYHLLFNSEQDFEQAHSTHSFLDNAYWGLPAGIQFKHNPNIELSKILNVMSQFSTTSPMLPYSIVLLYFRLDMFSQLLEILAIPFLPFFSVLLYRIDKWSFLREDTALRESVFNAFLTQTVQTPSLMSEDNICQISDVIFRMILLIQRRQEIQTISLNEAYLLLQILAQLLCMYDKDNDLLSRQKFHISQTKIFHLIPSSILIQSIGQCIVEDQLIKPPLCNGSCIDEVIVWNTLYCIEFPSSYGWVDSVSKEFSKRLQLHSLQCLLNSICYFETEFSPTLSNDIGLELIQIAKESPTPLEDHELMVQSVVKVPENKFPLIIDVLAKIIMLHRMDIIGTNAIEHILSVSWYPMLFSCSSTHLLKCSVFPESDTLLTLCMETIHTLNSELHKLTISVNHLQLVIKYRSTYYLLIKSLSDTSADLDEVTFTSALDLRKDTLDYFLHQYGLIIDLKRLLDSTNSGFHSMEVSEFLVIEYDTKPISFLCSSSGENIFVLLPGNKRFDCFNKSPIKMMLDALSDFLQSQFFKSHFKENLRSYMQTAEFTSSTDIDTIYTKLWLPTLLIVSNVISSLISLDILLNSIEHQFAIFGHNPEKIKDELLHLLPVLERLGFKYNPTQIEQSLKYVIDYFRLKRIQKLVSYILQIKNAYALTEEFSDIEFIASIHLNAADNKLSIITPELLRTADILSDLTDLHSEILQTLLDCVELFTWTAGVLHNSADLDNFTDLALNTVDSTCFNVNRITSFKEVCTIFMPFILGMENVDEHCFLIKLKLVHDYLTKTNKALILLRMSRDCAKQSEIDFWKELKHTHSSVGGKTISQLNQIMKSGKFILSTCLKTRSINDILNLRVCSNTTQTDQMYSWEALRELQSNIILITPLMHEDKDSAKFVAVLAEVIILADLFLQMHTSGNVVFRELTHEYTCQSIDRVKQDISFLYKECEQWRTQLTEARDKFYLLNYFTAAQIVSIQIGLDGMDNGKDLDRDTFHLLTLVREHLSQQDIEDAYSRLKHGSVSYESPTDSLISSLDSTATSSSRTISAVFSDNEDPLLLKPSLLKDCIPNILEIDERSLEEVCRTFRKACYSFKYIATFLEYLGGKNEMEDIPFDIPSPFNVNEPNLISEDRSKLLLCVLSLYLQSGYRLVFPSHHQVLICSAHTTLEEVDTFWRRALYTPSSSELFCLAFIENLKYEAAVQSVCTLKKHLHLLQKGEIFRLVVLCSKESEQSSYMATALGHYKRIYTQYWRLDIVNLKQKVFEIINSITISSKESPFLPISPSSIIDPDMCCIRIISSVNAGSGKSLTVSRQADKLKNRANVPLPTNMCTTINIFESRGCEHRAATKLIDFPPCPSPYGRICHLDITATCYEELIPFLFKLLITGVICDEYGRIWRCSKRNYYIIEITLSSQSPELLNFLALFPDWQCLDPNRALEYLKLHKELPIGIQITLFDFKEMKSSEYQRVYAYLNKTRMKQKSHPIDTYRYRADDRQCESQVEMFDIFLKGCAIGNPSWSILKHFISFLNNQLIECERNIYCNLYPKDKNWKGFKSFLVDCIILMSRDFTTPSLNKILGGTPNNIIQGYCIEQSRKWDEKIHPYIFVNEDGHTMSFFGIYITEQLDQLYSSDSKRIIGKKVFPKELYKMLKLNKADMEQDCSEWDRNKMISILSNVMDSSAIPWTDVDPCYVLTVDNLKKMLAIHMRFRCNIPVIIMGETGCGKTRLINFMCKLQAKRRNIENLVVLKVHGETTRQDVLRSYEKALALAKLNFVHGVDTILFFDETNTSPMIGLIKEILCDRRMDGSPIPTDIRLQFIAACNPYREHNPEMKKKLASAGLGMISGDRMVREHFGDIPLRDLVYRVIPLPESLLSLVWDFGRLTSETENSYISEIINFYVRDDSFNNIQTYCCIIAKVLSSTQKYMRERRDECSFVSLRDVERAVRIMLWFYLFIPKLQIKSNDIPLITYCLILSLSVCYRSKLKDRIEFDSRLIASLKSPLSAISETSIIGKEIDRCQTSIVGLMRIPDHIARNTALKENLFMMYVCIQLKIPLFIIGKPGSSKSLARSIINHSINEGILVGGNKIAEYTRVYMQCYQCSQYTTSKEISDLFDKCQTIQREAAADSVACVVLDEVGLAEDSPNLPLKVLHSLLEDSATSEFAQRGPNVAFVGLSNWALDPAKMNRGIMVQLQDPSTDELVNTAHAIIKPSGQVDDLFSGRLTPYVKILAEGYLELSSMQKTRFSKEYFGLRDFYCLIKMLYSLCKQYNTPLNRRILIHALKRNFGGITDIDVIEVFSLSLTGLNGNEIGPLSDPLSLISASLDVSKNSVSSFDLSRYLLLLTENYAALDILFQSKILNEDTRVMFGSSFPLDRESFNICHNINRLKIHMEFGHVVVLTNLSNLYESLYELLNQFYVPLFGKYWVPIGIGSQRVECPVDPNFRLIVVADKTTVYEQFPPPLINRFEKHFLTNSTVLSSNPAVQGIVIKLSLWIIDFVTMIDNAHKYKLDRCFIGFQEDTPSFVVYSTISNFGFTGREKENELVILDVSKLELLKLASPDSILRLHSSKLKSEAKSISNSYFSFNLFSLSDYLLHLFKKQAHIDNLQNTQQTPNFSFITTRSQLLTDTDISELTNKLDSSPIKLNISNLYLSQFKSENEFVSCILHEISSLPPCGTADRKLIFIQCADGDKNSDLISCAKFKVKEIVNESKTGLNPNLYFLFIVSLSLTTHNSSFAAFCGTSWDSVHIDELRTPSHNLLPPLNAIKQISVADIFHFQVGLANLLHPAGHIYVI